MTSYPCPRTDLACVAAFPSTGDLDFHTVQVHGYRGMWRVAVSLRPPRSLPIGPPPARRVPDGLTEGPGTPTMTAPAPTMGVGAAAAVGATAERAGRRARVERHGGGWADGREPADSDGPALAGRHERSRPGLRARRTERRHARSSR